MAILSEVADSASCSSFAIALAVSATVGGVLIYFNCNKLFTWTKNRIKQTRQVLGLDWRQANLRLENSYYSRLEEGQVDPGQTNKVKNASYVPRSAANHQQSFTSIVRSGDQRVQLNAAHTSRSARASQVERETFLSSLVAEAGGDSELRGTTNLVSNNPMSVHTSDLNEPTNKYEHVSDAKNRTDNGEHDMKQKDQVGEDKKQNGPPREGEGDSRHKATGLPSDGAQRLGKLDVADCWTDEAFCGIGFKHQPPNDVDAEMLEFSRELRELGQGPSTSTGEAQAELESQNMSEVDDTTSEVALWRLAANRCAPTEAMIEMILKLVPDENIESS